jgi:hypothetical protein
MRWPGAIVTIAVSALVLPAAAAGCAGEAVTGPGEAVPLDGASGDAPAGDATTDVSPAPDAGPHAPKDGATSHDAMGPGPEGGGGPCTTGTGQCSGQQPQTCVNGQWQPAGGPCPYLCANGVCTGYCTPGAVQCSGQQPQVCDATGVWQSSGPLCPHACTAGACAGSCAPGATQCSGATLQTCDSAGTWQNGSTCPYVCSAGACTGTCVPGATQCSGATPQTCNAMGAWQSGATCPYACTAGACTGVCTPNSTEPCASCGTTGSATCTASYAWGACAPPAGVCSYVDQSCAASCDTVSSCWVGVDRSVNPSTGEHFYTTSNSEASCCGFTVETLDYYYLYTATQSGLVPFYRCLLSTGFHFYTTSSTCEGSVGATNEGSMGFIASGAVCGAVPLYRLSDATGDHLYTISASEVTSAEGSGYTSEGVAGYVWTAPEG